MNMINLTFAKRKSNLGFLFAESTRPHFQTRRRASNASLHVARRRQSAAAATMRRRQRTAAAAARSRRPKIFCVAYTRRRRFDCAAAMRRAACPMATCAVLTPSSAFRWQQRHSTRRGEERRSLTSVCACEFLSHKMRKRAATTR